MDILVFVKVILHTFRNDNINCRMSSSRIVYYGIVIGDGNIIWFCNYNRNQCRGGWSIGIGIGNDNIIHFCD